MIIDHVSKTLKLENCSHPIPTNLGISRYPRLKPPKHFLSRRAFLHMFAIIVSWLVFIPAIYSPHGPACPARARGRLGNDRGAVGVVLTILRGQRAWTDLKKRHFEATLDFSDTLQTMWYRSEAAYLLWHIVSELLEKTKPRLIEQLATTGHAVHGHTAVTQTSRMFLSA